MESNHLKVRGVKGACFQLKDIIIIDSTFPLYKKSAKNLVVYLFHCNFCWADNDNSQVHIIIIYREAEMLHCCHCNDCMILGIIVGANSDRMRNVQEV
jgi:hypothetical protein